MNYEKVIMSIAIMTIIFSTGIARVDASDTDDFDNVRSKNIKIEKILESIESSNYKTWRRLVNPNSKIAKKVSEKDFNEFVKARSLARQGDYQKSLDIYEKLKEKISFNEDSLKKVVGFPEGNN